MMLESWLQEAPETSLDVQLDGLDELFNEFLKAPPGDWCSNLALDIDVTPESTPSSPLPSSHTVAPGISPIRAEFKHTMSMKDWINTEPLLSLYSKETMETDAWIKAKSLLVESPLADTQYSCQSPLMMTSEATTSHESSSETDCDEDMMLMTRHGNGSGRRLGAAERQERRRRQQRGYEKMYRKRKLVEVRRLKVQWAEMEAAARQILSGKMRPFTAPSAQTTQMLARYRSLLEEQQALEMDKLLLKSHQAVYGAATLRQYHNMRSLRSARSWKLVSERAIGIAPSQTLFAPCRFNFTW